MNKKIFFFYLFIIILVNCSYFDTKQINITKPSFVFQKSYILQELIIGYTSNFYVWNTGYSLYLQTENIKNEFIFSSNEIPSINEKKYKINDVMENKIYYLKENIDSKNIEYDIYDNNNLIIKIKQIDKDNFLNYKFFYNNNEYEITGTQYKINNSPFSFIYIIKRNDIIYGYIYKSFYYFKNEYEIVINKEYEIFKDAIFINFATFIDNILKQQNFVYK